MQWKAMLLMADAPTYMVHTDVKLLCVANAVWEDDSYCASIDWTHWG